ncbi:MAG: aspartyl-tRNA amidotransferase subunit B [Ectothiorhodospiraceae bacterium]|nr:MAG: aspartyl-tRNA amidotransferase subunit B [Ectothiorhodospiraceae bacterium]|tara:strand:+ start:202 stop:657 length:456 start_codon:yes stop_codon:yes gene_type:complete
MMAKSAIKDSIQQDQINFLKEGKKEDSSILRFALSFINKEEKDKQIELSDSEVVAVIKSLIKRNKDSYDQFTSANRPELAEKEKKEMDLLQSYLPEVMNENETEEIVKSTIDKLGISSMKEMGKAMGEIKKNHADTIDLSLVSQLIKKHLS